MKRFLSAVFFLLVAAVPAWAQDQQLGARTKAMGGSYTAFEDDPVSVWLNPAGIATQLNSLALAYQAYVTYPLHQEKAAGSTTVTFSAGAETTFVDPALLPSFLGLVFHVGPPDSAMAVGVCYAQPYHLNYSFDQVNDPLVSQFVPDSNVDQSFGRFRVCIAKDFRFKNTDEPGFFTHLSAGAGLDLGYERWEFRSAAGTSSDNSTGLGGGAGLLLGVYDDLRSFRVNFGVAWQSAVHWNFNIDPDIFPAFDMPQQVNAGATFYILSGFPLRMTTDFQWIEWSRTADVPIFAGRKEFRDAFNVSIGGEYRIPIMDKTSLYPRLGYRRVQAAWSDKNNLPMTGSYQLVLDTKAAAFNIITFGLGLVWLSDDNKVRAVDIGGDAGGDSYTFAFGVTYEF